MWYRCTRWLVEIIAATLAGAAVLLALLIWRLHAQPVDAGWLTQMVRQHLAENLGYPLTVTYDKAQLRFMNWDDGLELQWRQLTVAADNDRWRVVAPALRVTLPLLPLLVGQSQASTVVLERPTIQWLVPTAAPANAGDFVLPATLPDVVTIIDGRIFVDIQALEASVAITDITGQVLRVGQDSQVTINGVLQLAETNTPLTVRGTIQPQRSSVTVQAEAFRPSVLAAVHPLLAELAVVDIPLTSTLTMLGDAQRTALQLAVRFGTGQLLPNPYYPQGLPVQGGELQAAYILGTHNWRVDKLEVVLPQTTITATAALTNKSVGQELAAQVAVTPMTTAALFAYWPIGVAHFPRLWVTTNLSDGMIDNARASFLISLPDKQWTNIELINADATIDFSGLTVRYAPMLPPVRNVQGQARSTADDFKVRTTGGEVEGLRVIDAAIDIAGLQQPQQIATITVNSSGALASALALIDHPDLRFVSERGIDRRGLTGQADAVLNFRLPLENELTWADITASVEAVLSNVSWPNAWREHAVSAEELKLSVNNDQMVVAGEVKVAQQPVVLLWQENFTSEPQRHYTLQGQLSPAVLADFATLSAPVAFELDYKVQRNNTGLLTANADFTKALVELEVPTYRKEVGQPLRLQLAADLVDDTLRRLRTLTIKGHEADVAAVAQFDKSGAMTMVRVEPLRLGATTASLKGQRQDKQLKLELLAEMLDISGFFADNQPVDPAASTLPDLFLNARAGVVVTSPTGRLRDLTTTLQIKDNRWEALNLSALQENDKLFQATIARDDQGRRLQVQVDETGALLKTLGVFNDLVGGTLTIDGRFDDSVTPAPLRGLLKMGEYSVKNMPILANILSLASLTGLPDLLTGSGIRFDRLRVDFTKQNEVYTVHEGIASGQSLGLSFKGPYHRGKRTVDFTGTVIPAYLVNNFLAKIPVLGDLLTGGGEGGLFAVMFTAQGSLDEPKVSVNPLTALTPGIMRGIFEDEAPATP